MPLVTLTTDFGCQDWFVGTMKGVILGLQPRAQIVDITHQIPAGDIFAGAFALAAASPYFPEGTVHIAVVDPGVGGARAAIAAQTRRGYFVGPDNGVLSLALAREQVVGIRRIENPRLILGEVSQTFHGRDVFAPLGAHLSRGIPFEEVGPEWGQSVCLEFPPVVQQGGCWQGAVVYIDRFGNAITNLTRALPVLARPEGVRVRVAGREAPIRLCRFYQQERPGQALAILGSAGFVEIGVAGGDGSRDLRLRVGDPVWVESGESAGVPRGGGGGGRQG